MRWATNPFSTRLPRPGKEEEHQPGDPDPDPEKGDASSSEESSGGKTRPTKTKTKKTRGFQAPTRRLTAHQFYYIFVLDGLGAAAVSGGINFAIAYAMYGRRNHTSSSSSSSAAQQQPVRLWAWPNTLAGDAAVTVVIQCLITWAVELFLVNRALRRGGVRPIGFVREPRRNAARWFMMLPPAEADRGDDHRKEQQEEAATMTNNSRRSRLRRWAILTASQALRALLVAAACFPLIWGASIGFLVLIGRRVPPHHAPLPSSSSLSSFSSSSSSTDDGEEGISDWDFGHRWTPQLFKLVQGAVLGLLATPPMVVFWLLRSGWAIRRRDREREEQEEQEGGRGEPRRNHCGLGCDGGGG
ncbi:hypothetical protein GGR56DRAFT_674215 [Xylariaceae sp. FL0804]|nr:hypothetical protein GGR56DRAFT_674215 [Xylariaceae sp. FL0804]